MFRYKKIIRHINAYLLFTVLFYFIGPIRWRSNNNLELVLYLLAISLSLYLGFSLYFHKHKNEKINTSPYEQKDDLIINHLKYMLVLNLIVFSMYLIRNLGGANISWSNIILWLTNPSTQYMEKFNNQIGTFGRIAAALATFSSFFLWATIPLGIFYFRKLSVIWKAFVIMNIIIEALRWLAMGTNKGIIDLIIIFICLLYVKMLYKDFRLSRRAIYLIVAGALLVLGLSYFATNISGRTANYVYFMNNLGGNTLDLDNWMIKLFPVLEGVIIYADSYLTQGYYGLSLCMKQNFTPMFGIGNSVFLRENIEEIFNTDLFQYTYMHKANSLGWSEKSNWHTAYAWFANDLGFIGTLVVIFIFGYYFAFICKHLFEDREAIFLPLFCLMIQMFFYFPMNNQIFNMPFSFMGFVGLNLYIFLLKHHAIVPKYFVIRGGR